MQFEQTASRQHPQEAVGILEIVNEKGSITRKDIELHLKVGTATAVRVLRKMVEEGILTPVGKGKNTHYVKHAKIAVPAALARRNSPTVTEF